jgi:hypothetical protein
MFASVPASELEKGMFFLQQREEHYDGVVTYRPVSKSKVRELIIHYLYLIHWVYSESAYHGLMKPA